MKKSIESILQILVVILFLLVFAGWLIWSVYSTFYLPEKPNTITINVTGIVNATNSSIVSLQLECLKTCIEQYKSYGLGYQTNCYGACSKLGGCTT